MRIKYLPSLLKCNTLVKDRRKLYFLMVHVLHPKNHFFQRYLNAKHLAIMFLTSAPPTRHDTIRKKIIIIKTINSKIPTNFSAELIENYIQFFNKC